MDETYHGKSEKPHTPSHKRYGRPYTKRGRTGGFDKRIIVSLVERHGSVRSFHVGAADKPSVTKIIRDHVAKESRIHTDECKLYVGLENEYESHETVQHRAKEYVRGDVTLDCSSAASTAFISIAGRSICTGICQNTTSATIIASGLGSMIWTAPSLP